MERTDSEIRNAVLSELAWDSRVEDANIGVAVDEGVVCLTGVVSSWGARLAAREAAYHVRGVNDVDNRIDVKIGDGNPSDLDIAAAVRSALDWDVFIPGTRIRSSVHEGQVRLRGEVEYCWQRDAAEKAVRNIAGVRSVLDEIQVKPAPIAPSEIRKSIEAALERRASREARSIDLEIHDGSVVVSGVVHSWPERQSVLRAIKNSPGVRSVEDKLQIEA